MRKRALACVFISSFEIAACTTIPELEEATGGIPVREIVLRVKCELSDAFITDDRKWLPDTEKGKFAWLRNWTAQVDLTLQVLDTATLSPGASLNQQLHNGYAVAAGPTSVSTSGVLGTTIAAIPQSFVLAGGASLNGQAQRTDTISFAVGLRELAEWRRDPGISKLCAPSDKMDLRGSLGLKTWIAEALSPVAKENEPHLPEYLWSGIHPKPGASAPVGQGPTKADSPPTLSSKSPPNVSALAEVCTSIDDLKEKISRANVLLKDAISDASAAVTSSTTAANNAKSNLDSASKTLTDVKRSFSDYAAKNGVFDATLDPSISSDVKLLNSAAKEFIGGADRLHSSVKTTAGAAGAAQGEATKAAQTVLGVKNVIDEENRFATSYDAAKDKDKTNLTSACKKIMTVLANADQTISDAASAKYYADIATKNSATTAANFKLFTDYANVASEYISKLPTIDPPISAIGQSVQFILNYGGSISPTWTFVVFHGPNSPLFAASGTRTHILNVTLGPIAAGSFSAPSAAVTQNQLYLLLNNLLPTQPH
jgi:hypothetical protein